MNRLIVRVPDSLRAERAYAAHVVLQVHLGIDHRIVYESRSDVALSSEGDPGRELCLPDGVFSAGEAGWPATAPRPAPIDMQRLQCLDVAPDAQACRLDVDVFGAAFWYLTRLEEIQSDARDEHGRFPVEAGLDESQQPVVDLMADAFGACLNRLWPALELRQHRFEVAATHDVDRPFKHLYQTPRRLVRSMVRDLLDGANWLHVLRSPWRRHRVRSGELAVDPFNTFDWLMDRSDDCGVQSTFYFVCTDAPGGIDGDYRVDDPPIRGLLRRIHERGHLIGLHGSYQSSVDPQRLKAEVQRLRAACAAEGVPLDRIRARQHVLRFDPRRTVAVWAQAGIDEDSTLGHAGRPGFRCGTCRAYPLFDVPGRRMTQVVERPLIVMDVSLTARRYEGLTASQANARIHSLQQQCRLVQGSFVLLWHNCRLESPEPRAIYTQAVAAARH